MKKDVGFCSFTDAFRDYNRQNNFSYEGLTALYDYLIEYEESCGEEIELDVIALCCEYTEYESATEAACEYFDFEGMTYGEEDGGELETVEEVEDKAIKFLQDRTQLIIFDSGVIIQDF